MKINKFEVITGTCIEEIPGQWRLGYSLSDTSDFYDVACWADERDCAKPEYRYYEKLVVRDFDGNVISEELGCLYQRPDGSWWIA